MKIVHVVKKYPEAMGGDAVVVANLKKQQEAAGHSVVIVTSNCDDIENGKHIRKVGLKDTAEGLDVITASRLASLIILFFRMFAILRKERPDVIHAHSVDMTFFVSFAARMYRIPMIHTFHIVTFYDSAQSALRRKSELWLAKKSRPTKVTAPNTYDVKKLQLAGLQQTVLLPNGVDLAQWEAQGYTEKNREATFVAVGRLENQKGYQYLIKAAALLAKKHPIKVIIVGEGSQKNALLQQARNLNIEAIVTLAGKKRPEQIRRLLERSHVAVFPSLYETTPLTLLEAWAAGAPVVATPVGILRDTPTHFNAAVIVPPKNEKALASAMRRLVEDEPLSAAIMAAGQKEAAKYAWPTIARELEVVYRSVL